jgi:hypothetical protein
MDEDIRNPGADIYDGLGPGRSDFTPSRRANGTGYRKRGQIYADRLDTGRGGCGNESLDHLGCSCNQQHTHHVILVLRYVVIDYLKVQLGGLDGHRDLVRDLIAQGRSELLLLEEREVYLTNYHPLIRHADNDSLRFNLGHLHEPADGFGHSSGVCYLPVDNRALGKSDLTEGCE